MPLKRQRNLIQTEQQWLDLVKETNNLTNKVIEDINFKTNLVEWDNFTIHNTTFLGCSFEREDAVFLIDKGAFIYPKFKNMPYNPYQHKLYSWQELMEGYESGIEQTQDFKIYEHFSQHKYNTPMNEALAQRIHDFGIDEALKKTLSYDEEGKTHRKPVGFMGGHSARRGSEYYTKVALAAKRASEKGYYVVTGGGPGIMEAANLGAYMGNYTDENLYEAIQILSDLIFKDENDADYLAVNYFDLSKKVLELFPDGKESMAIPTWFYGHEPSNLFASHIAKYFSNSIREDILLAVSIYGIIYAPGSAGTTQEIFQEAAQNHYATFGYYSPMVFLGKKRYTEDTALYSVLHQLAVGREYKELLYLTDDPELAVEYIVNHPPVRA